MKNIFRNYEKMNATEIKILQYIIKNIDEIQKITVKELSQRLFVSKTTIINLAKKLGYEGFSELRFFLKNISEKRLFVKSGGGKSSITLRDSKLNKLFKVVEFFYPIR